MASYCPANKYNRTLELLEDDPVAGLEALERLAKKYPNDPSVRHALGLALLESGGAAAALPHLEHAAKRLRPSDADLYPERAYRALHLAYAQLGMTAHMFQALRRARQHGADDLPEPNEALQGDLPEGAEEKDLLEFERARFDLLHGATKRGITAMSAFVERFPEFQPARNNLATGYFVQGDHAKYREATLAALEHAPENIHALNNYARLVLLEQGPKALKDLLPRIVSAPVRTEDGVVDGEIVQAQTLAFAGDDEGVKRALQTYDERHPDEEHPAATQLRERLAARTDKTKPSARPYYVLHDLIPGLVAGWRRANPKNVGGIVREDLMALPGLLTLIPDQLGFEVEPLALLLALTLLDRDVLDKDVPASAEPWPDVLRRVALDGPGERATRLALLQLLMERGLVAKDEPVPFEGIPGGVNLLELELTTEPELGTVAKADEDRLEAATLTLQAHNFSEAREMFEALAKKYPEHSSVQFNLAISELHDSSLRGGKARGQKRIESLLESHPQYLFARAHLATEAVERGDLERAQELLRWPEGLKRIHVQEYGLFAAAQGRLALAEGDRDAAEKQLDLIEELLGEESSAYQVLERALNPKKRGLSRLLGQ
ncbi:hypothetical protein BH24DEI2_BH24DEI2_05550 [soil metagenome]